MSNTPAIRVDEPGRSTFSWFVLFLCILASNAHTLDTQFLTSFKDSEHKNTLPQAATSVKPPRAPSHLLELPDGAVKEARLSEFYDAYYRQSHMFGSDAKPYQVDRQSTIPDMPEVDSPLPGKSFGHAM